MPTPTKVAITPLKEIQVTEQQQRDAITQHRQSEQQQLPQQPAAPGHDSIVNQGGSQEVTDVDEPLPVEQQQLQQLADDDEVMKQQPGRLAHHSATPPPSAIAKSLFSSSSLRTPRASLTPAAAASPISASAAAVTALQRTPAAAVGVAAGTALQRTPTPLKRYLKAIEEKEGALKWNLTPLGTPQELKDRSDVMKVSLKEI